MTKKQLRKLAIALLDDEQGINDLAGDMLLKLLKKAGHAGGAISDKELEDAIPALSKHVAFLEALPEKFHFTWHALYDFLIALKGYQEARKLEKRRCAHTAQSAK